VIDNGVIVEVGAMVEAKRIGEGCVIEVNAKIGKGAVVGKVRNWPQEASIMLNCWNSIVRSGRCAKWSKGMSFQTSR
jgi:predicted protein tyrosine phosphatase